MSVLDLHEGTYVSVVWNTDAVESGGETVELLGAVLRQPGDPKWHVRYRFRYHRDDRVHDSRDEKCFYAATVDGDEDDVVEKILGVMLLSATKAGATLHVCHIRSDDHEVVLEGLNKLPGMHIMFTPEGAPN